MKWHLMTMAATMLMTGSALAVTQPSTTEPQKYNQQKLLDLSQSSQPKVQNTATSSCAQTLSQSIAVACNKKMQAAGKEDNIIWESQVIVKQLCSRSSYGIGDGTTHSVIGAIKPCQGAVSIPAYEGWVCQFTASKTYQVKVRDVIYSTCSSG